MDNTTDIIVDRKLQIVWDFITTKENWQKWWGGELQRVEPGWQTGATIFWGNGNSSTITHLIHEKEIQISSTWLGRIFRFYAMDNGKTRVEVEFFPRGGASFSDGGAAHKTEMASTLNKLKQCVEGISEGKETVEKSAPTSDTPAAPISALTNNYKEQFSDDEWMTLQCAIYWVFRQLFLLHRGGDVNKITEDQKKAFGTVLRTVPVIKSALARQVLLSLTEERETFTKVWAVCFMDPRHPADGLVAVSKVLDGKLPTDSSLEFKRTLLILGRFIHVEHEKFAGTNSPKKPGALSEANQCLILAGSSLGIPEKELMNDLFQIPMNIYDLTPDSPQNGTETMEAKSEIESHIRSLENDDPHVYFDAIDNLIKNASHDLVLTSLLSTIGDGTKTSQLRKHTAFALAHMACPRPSESSYTPVIPHVIELLEGQDINIRNWIIEGIGGIEFGKTIPPDLIKPISLLLNDPDWNIRGWAVTTLGYAKDQSVVESLITKLNDGIWDVRRRAVLALGKIKDPRAIDPIKELAAKEKDMGGWILGRISADFGDKTTSPVPVKPVVATSSNLDAAINKYISKEYVLISRTSLSASLKRQTPVNWVILIALLITLPIVAIIYLLVRKKYQVQLVQQSDGHVTESGGTLEEFERDQAKETKKRKSGRTLLFLGILICVTGILLGLVLLMSGLSDSTLSKDPGGIVTTLLVCPTPIIFVGLLLLAIGIYNLRSAEKETAGLASSGSQTPASVPVIIPTPVQTPLPVQSVIPPQTPREKLPVAPTTSAAQPIQAPISAVPFANLLAKLNSPKWETRRDAANELGQTGDSRAVEPLIDALKLELSTVLGRGNRTEVGTHPATGELLVSDGPLNLAIHPTTQKERLIDDMRKYVQSKMIEALGNLGDPRSIDVIKGILQSECYDIVRKAALEAQKKLEDRVKAQAVEMSKPAEAEEQENAAELSPSQTGGLEGKRESEIDIVKRLIRESQGAKDFYRRALEAGFQLENENFAGLMLKGHNSRLILQVFASHGADKIFNLTFKEENNSPITLIREGERIFLGAELSSSQTGRLEGKLVEAELKEDNQRKRPSLAGIPVFLCPVQSDKKCRFDAKLMTRSDTQNALVFDSVGIGEYVVLYNPFPISDEQAYLKYWDGRELDFTDLDAIISSLMPLAEAVEAGKAEALNSHGSGGGLGMDVNFIETKAVRTTYIRGNTALWVPGQKSIIMEFVDKNQPLTVRIEVGQTTHVTVQCHATGCE